LKHREAEAAEIFREAGYEVFEHGWPDFLLSRDGELLAVEYKNDNDRCSDRQKQIHGFLNLIGLRTVVVYEGELKKNREAVSPFLGSLKLSHPRPKVSFSPRCDVRTTADKVRAAWNGGYFKSLQDAVSFYHSEASEPYEWFEFWMTSTSAEFNRFFEVMFSRQRNNTMQVIPKSWKSQLEMEKCCHCGNRPKSMFAAAEFKNKYFRLCRGCRSAMRKKAV
jgi:hypothetical protein